MDLRPRWRCRSNRRAVKKERLVRFCKRCDADTERSLDAKHACLVCVRRAAAEWRRQNPDKVKLARKRAHVIRGVEFCARCNADTETFGDGSCRLCRQRYMREYRATHLEAFRETCRRYTQRVGFDRSRRSNWPKTLFDRAWLLQKGRCAICDIPMRPNGQARDSVAADHDHDSGRPRGLLCAACNKGIGHFSDDPQTLRRAAAYLEKHSP